MVYQCFIRVSSLETSCEKHNHALDDEDIKKAEWYENYLIEMESESNDYKRQVDE